MLDELTGPERLPTGLGGVPHGQPLVAAGTADAQVKRAVAAARVKLKAELEAAGKK